LSTTQEQVNENLQMPTLSEYSNVYGTCIDILQKKGWRCWYDKQLDLYCAEKDGWDFMGNSPAGLLGMIAIYEFRSPERYSEYWWRSDDPVGPYRDLSEEKPDFVPIWERQKRSNGTDL
jgi:hypothetical protein